MNAPSLPDSIGAAPVAAVRWGGLADTVRQDCLDSDNLDVKTADLLQRLDKLAACSGLNEVAQFLDSPRGFSVLERNYLMSPLLDEIYACLTVPLRAKAFSIPDSWTWRHSDDVMPFELGMADDATDRIPVRPDRTGLAVLVACMKGCAEALEFVLHRERHLVTSMSCVLLLALLGDTSAQAVRNWTDCSQKGRLIIQPSAIASYWGHVSCVECLLRHGADVHGDQDCALRCAAAEGHDLVVDLLLRAGADVHVWNDVVLAAATNKQHVFSVKRLLQAGADVSACAQRAIFIAARSPNVELLRMLLDALGDKPMARDLLMYAIRGGRPDNLQLLLDRGADLNDQDLLPLSEAMCRLKESSMLISIVDILIKAGADVHARQHEALRLAIKSGRTETARRLLHHGASLQAVLNDPQAEIATMAGTGDVFMIELLLDSGMPLNGAHSSQLLTIAAENRHTAVIELLERRGAPPVSVDNARLITSAQRGDLQLVQELLKRELDPVAVHGQALRAAVKCNHELVVATLLEHGRRVGPAPPETRELRQFCMIHAAFFGLMSIFRMLVDHIAFDAANDLGAVLDTLLTGLYVCESAARLLLDRYAGTLLSVAELRRLSDRLPRDGPGRDVLRPYLTLKHKRGS